MWFLAFYQKSGAPNKTFVEVTEDIVEPLKRLEKSQQDREGRDFIPGDSITAVNCAGREVTGQIVSVQPDGRLSVPVEGEDTAFSLAKPKDVTEVHYRAENEGGPKLKGAIAHESKDACLKIKAAICSAVGQEPSGSPWWSVHWSRWQAVVDAKLEEVYFDYTGSYSEKEFQQILKDI